MKNESRKERRKAKAKKEKGKAKKRKERRGRKEGKKKDGISVLSPIHSFAGYFVSLFCRHNTSERSNSFA